MRRFAICLDGTWNHAAQEHERDDGTRVYRPSNVLKLARAIEKSAAGVEQITYYDAGVGAMNRAPDMRAKAIRYLDNSLGGAWGAGFEVNIEEAYTFIANNYAPGDELFVFGFSRGAAQARSLCNLIEWTGGVPRKSDVFYAPTLFGGYLECRGAEGRCKGVVAAINERRRKRDQDPLPEFIPVHIRFLGVWDTVLSLGSRLNAGATPLAFHTPSEPPSSVARICHALAIDESRHDFRPEIWHPNGTGARLEQRWFAGVHSNVGGGLIDDSLANCALRWITDEAEKCGLAVDRPYLSFFREYPQGSPSSKSMGFEVLDTLLRPLRGFEGVRDMTAIPGTTLDQSVFERLHADPAKHKGMGGAYRPENLRRYLAANPALDDRLTPPVLEWVRGVR